MRQVQGHPKQARATHALDAGGGGHPACHENDDVARPLGEPVPALAELGRKVEHVRVHRSVGALELLTQLVIHLTDNGGGQVMLAHPAGACVFARVSASAAGRLTT